MFDSLIEDIKKWCAGRNWWLRAPLLIYFAYVMIRHLQSPMYKSIIGALNLGIHELGHVIFTPFGRFMHFLGGSLAQCAVPVIGMFNFYRQRDYFAISLCFGWLSTNLFEVAAYMSDAKAKSMPLVGLGFEPPIHDWSWLFRKMKIIEHCGTIAGFTQLLAVLAMMICLVTGFWMIMEMIKEKNSIQ